MMTNTQQIGTGLDFPRLCLSPAGEQAVVWNRNVVSCYDLRGSIASLQWTVPDLSPRSCAISDKLLLCCRDTGPLVLLDVFSGKMAGEVPLINQPSLRPPRLFEVAVSPTEPVALVQAAFPAATFLFNTQRQSFITKHPGPWGNALYHPTGNFVIQKSLDSYQAMVFAEMGSQQGLNFLKPLYLLDESVLAYGFSALGDAFAAVSARKERISLSIFTFPGFQLSLNLPLDSLELALTERLPGNRDAVTIYPHRVLFFDDSQLLLFAANGTLLLAETTSGTITNEFHGHSTSVVDVAALPQLGLLASVDVSGNLLIWRTEPNAVLPTVMREMWRATPWYTAGRDAPGNFEFAYSLKEGRLVAP